MTGDILAELGPGHPRLLTPATEVTTGQPTRSLTIDHQAGPIIIDPVVLIVTAKLRGQRRPHENIDSDTQDQLDAIRDSWDLAYDSLPRSADIHPRSLRQLLGRFPMLQPPVIHGLLRMGETMNIIAPPKAAKSWLASDMALAVATGRPWLDRFPI